MNTQEVSAALASVDRVRERTRSDLRSSWFPLVLFGSLTVLSGILSLAYGPVVFAPFWAVAGPLGGILTGAYYVRRQQRKGVLEPSARYVVLAVALMAGCFATGWGGAALGIWQMSVVGPYLVVSAAYVLFAIFEHSPLLAWISGSLAVLTVLVGLFANSSATAGPTLAFACGLVFLGTGIVQLQAERSHA